MAKFKLTEYIYMMKIDTLIGTKFFEPDFWTPLSILTPPLHPGGHDLKTILSMCIVLHYDIAESVLMTRSSADGQLINNSITKVRPIYLVPS